MLLLKLKATSKHAKHNGLFSGSHEKSQKSKYLRRVIRPDGSSKKENGSVCVIVGFRGEIDENYALLGYFATSSDHLLTTIQDNPSRRSRIQKHV